MTDSAEGPTRYGVVPPGGRFREEPVKMCGMGVQFTGQVSDSSNLLLLGSYFLGLIWEEEQGEGALGRVGFCPFFPGADLQGGSGVKAASGLHMLESGAG